MATTTPNYDATADTLTITLASLANGSWRQSTAFDNATDKFLDAQIGGKITTGTTPTAGGTIDVYLYGTYDDTTFTAGASGTDGAYTADGEEGLFFLLTSIVVDATSDQAYAFGPYSVLREFGGIAIPQQFGVVVENNTGVALNATGGNHEVKFTGVKLDSA